MIRPLSISRTSPLRAGKWAIECLANLAQLPPVGAAAFIGAVKVEGASGAPARVVAFW